MKQRNNTSTFRERRVFTGVLATVALTCSAFALVPMKPKPVGAVLTYVSTIKGVRINVLSARDAAGMPFSHPGSFGYSDRPESGGKTMGSAPRGYDLPPWVEFEWREPAYPGIVRAEGESYEDWGAKVDEKYRKLVRKKERVYVASKIPLAAIEEVRKAQAETHRGDLPKKMLWVYFVWTPTGIKVRWEVYRAYPGRRTPWRGDPLE